ncbi:hypothetical protein S40285_01015 [Stachybotrys chlorohalonatus IBT 40285]|uniref:Complex III subunit 9 n=1 Tax=Stachybotrys chlorohalonatus (strain IBT 40285) TaxID=1283841 RepID=A0A084QKJ7_STAC4|nr:hypothetical protein S40285_01015 [Stachybotrys chlorohalonata IBT 40285]
MDTLASLRDFANFLPRPLPNLQPKVIPFSFSRPPSTRDRFESPNCAILSKCALFRRNYVMLTAVFGAGFFFEMGFNSTMNKVWDMNNRGRQWKDIRHKYIQESEEDDE